MCIDFTFAETDIAVFAGGQIQHQSQRQQHQYPYRGTQQAGHAVRNRTQPPARFAGGRDLP